jgi:hypothetical protein
MVDLHVFSNVAMSATIALMLLVVAVMYFLSEIDAGSCTDFI